MTNIPDRITFRPGSLSRHLFAWCAEHNVTPSDAIRIAVAAMLGVDAPDIAIGRPPKQPSNAAGEQ